MALISDEDETFIRSHPLAPTLDTVRSSLNPTEGRESSTSSNTDADLSDRRSKLSDILALLQLHPVSKRLQTALGRPLTGQLGSLTGRLYDDGVDFSPFQSLYEAVSSSASDLDIWQTALRLADTLARTTPPPRFASIPNTYLGTPWIRSSASHQLSDQTRRDLEQPLRRELATCTFEGVPEFFTKYFEGKGWCSRAEEICRKLSSANDGDMLRDYPRPHEENAIWAWLDKFQTVHLIGAPGKYCRTTGRRQTNADIDRQLDIVVQPRDVTSVEVVDMSHVRVVGELTSSPKKDKWLPKFIQLATYVRDVFTRQSTRRYVHSFLLFDSQMQLWVFDRSGAYSSETFDIFEQAERFIHVIVGYALMSEDELGCDIFMQARGVDTLVSIHDAATGEKRDIELAQPAFVVQRAIVSRGTACFKSKDEKQVIKFSWLPEERRPESEYLRMARGTHGVAQLVGSNVVTSITDLRQDLTFTSKLARILPLTDTPLTGSIKSSFTSASRDNSGKPSIRHERLLSDDKDVRPTKKLRRSGPSGEVLSREEQHGSSPLTETRPLFRRRVLTCVAISPAGRPLHQFTSQTDFLACMRDAIRGHRSLFMERRVLHRDISENNIIYTDPREHGGFCGALIDLDMAVEVNQDGHNEQSGAQAMTGTLEFMALEILAGGLNQNTIGIEHTYRHDLESFFYVFIAVCTRYGWGNTRPIQSSLWRTWYTGTVAQIYVAKRGSIEIGSFGQIVLSNFSPFFATLIPLARELRHILFSDGPLYTGTPARPDELYEPIIEAFNRAIDRSSVI